MYKQFTLKHKYGPFWLHARPASKFPFSGGWCKFLLPGPVGCLSDTESLLWFCDASDNVFTADVHQLPHQLKWRKTGNNIFPCFLAFTLLYRQTLKPQWWLQPRVVPLSGDSTITRPSPFTNQTLLPPRLL